MAWHTSAVAILRTVLRWDYRKPDRPIYRFYLESPAAGIDFNISWVSTPDGRWYLTAV